LQRASIRLSPFIQEWEKLSRLLVTFCEEHQLSNPLCLDLQLVSEEWFTNIVVHGYEEGGIDREHAEPIHIELWLSEQDEVAIQFVDAAPAFNPLEHEMPDVSLPAEERAIGGLGIYLIKSKMDSCVYRRVGDCNQFTIRKYI
jgi:serine/threonine-protein kinase RsbW